MPANNSCCFCSLQSIERMTVKRLGRDSIVQYQPEDNGLQCSMCRQHACTFCLSKISESFSPLVRKQDYWCQTVQKFLNNGIVPDNFIGHCCELKVLQRQLGLDKIQPVKETRFDGHLYLPEFSLLIDSPFNCVDLHGLGSSDDLLPAVWHCVISHRAAESFHSNDVVPNGARASFIDELGKIMVIEVPSPYRIGDKLKVSTLRWSR